MALASREGYFELVEMSASPSVAKLGESVRLTLSLRNTSGAAITRSYITVTPCYRGLDGEMSAMPTAYVLGRESASFDPADFVVACAWAKGAVKTFTATVSFSPACAAGSDQYPDMSAHGMRADVSGRGLLLTVYRNTAADSFFDISGGYTCPAVVDERWQPSIAMSVRRGLVSGAASDEGERLLLSAKLDANAYADATRMRCRLHYAQGAPATAESSSIDLTDAIPALMAGVQDEAALVTRAFSNGVDWHFLMVFGDDYEAATAAGSLGRAFANLHLSGATTGGAAFGRFSSSTEGRPKLESEYPAHFYGGIETLEMHWEALTLSSGTGSLEIGRAGSHVYIRGEVTAASGATLVAALPFTPRANAQRLAACGGSRIARLSANANGTLMVDWVLRVADGATETTAVWICCNMDYWV